ncbi:MAG: hypothetical protein ABII64_09935 [Elusimicrobiota bacterium]
MKKEKILENLVILAAAALVAFIIFKAKWLLIVCLAFLVIAIIGGKPAYFIALGWTKFAHFIGRINTKILLSLIYYLFLTPISALFRIFNKEAAGNFKDKSRKTFFKDKTGEITPENFEKLW